MEDNVILQKELDYLFAGTSLNISKCDILHPARQDAKPVKSYTLGSEVINSVSEAKYQGVTLSNNYSTRTSQWKSYILDNISKANQRFGFCIWILGDRLISSGKLPIWH